MNLTRTSNGRCMLIASLSRFGRSSAASLLSNIAEDVTYRNQEEGRMPIDLHGRFIHGRFFLTVHDARICPYFLVSRRVGSYLQKRDKEREKEREREKEKKKRKSKSERKKKFTISDSTR